MTWSMQFDRKSFARVWFAIIACFLGALSHASAQVLTFEEAKQRADQGDAFAQAVVALHYQLGWNTQKNPELAAKYAIASAEAGHPLGRFRLGALLRAGEGVPKDEQQGLALQSASFNALYNAQDSYSITSAAIMIFQGKVVGQNISEDERRRDAASLYKKAAEMGYAPAQFNYAMALNDGHGVKKDATLFEQYLAKARARHYPLAEEFVARGNRIAKRRIAVEGVTPDGVRWAYEFLDQTRGNGAVRKLSSLGGATLLLSNEEWIVTAASSSVGYANSRTEIKFYDARDLKEVKSISVPNEVNHIDWSAERSQFLLITHPIGRAPSDEMAAQALVLVDLQNDALERVPLWSSAFGLAHLPHDFCTPLWRGSEVIVHYKPSVFGNASPINAISCNEQSFRDVKFKFIPTPESESLPKISSDSVNTESIELTGIPAPKRKQASIGAVRNVVAEGLEGVTLIRHSQPGALQKVNLNYLLVQTVRTEPVLFPQVGIFSNGVIHAASGNDVHLVGPTRENVIAIPTPEITHTWPLPDGGEGRTNLTRADNILRNEPMQVFFGASAGYCFAEDKTEDDGRVGYIKLYPDGHLATNAVTVPASSELGIQVKMRIEADRESMRLALGRKDEPLVASGVFKEFSLTDNKLLVGPEPIGTMLGPVDRKAGSAPPGWMVESKLLSAISGGTTYGIKVTNLSNRKAYSVFEVEGAAICNKEPALWFSSKEIASVLSHGEARADLHYLDVESGDVKHAKTWEWSAENGAALHEPVHKLLFIPQSVGYSIYDLARNSFERPVAEIFFSAPDEYAILLPNGAYAGSPGCESLLRLKAGDGSVDGSTIAQWRNRPAEVLKALGGDPEVIELLAKVTERWQKRIGFDPTKPEPKASDFPKVSVSERPPLWAKGEEASFTIRWEKGASPLKDVIVRVNGVESTRFEGDKLPAVTEAKGSVDATVKLAEGQNWIEVTAEDVEGRRSDLQRFRTILKDSPTETKRYIVALGVSEYAKPELNLQFAAKDAKDLLEALAGKGVADTGMFAKVFGQSGDAQGSDHVLLLTNDQVDRSAVEKIREFVGKSSENDEVILFCAGHGVLDDKLDYYYAGHDFDPARPAETGIKLDDLVGAISSAKALKRLVLLDTCHAGVVGEKDEMLLAQMDTKLPSGVRAVAQRGMKVQQATDFSASDKQRFIEEMFSLPGTIRGVNIIGASAGAQFALESDQWNNGVFTASVIEGLRDKKADWNEDGRITVSELKNYLGQRVSELTAGAQKPSVVAFEQDQDFDLIN